MADRSAFRIAAPVVLPRALLVWALTRLVIAALPLAAGEPFGSVAPPPIAVVVLAGVLGVLDVRVRGERILWGNFGLSSGALGALYAAAAAPAELTLALVRAVVGA